MNARTIGLGCALILWSCVAIGSGFELVLRDFVTPGVPSELIVYGQCGGAGWLTPPDRCYAPGSWPTGTVTEQSADEITVAYSWNGGDLVESNLPGAAFVGPLDSYVTFTPVGSSHPSDYLRVHFDLTSQQLFLSLVSGPSALTPPAESAFAGNLAFQGYPLIPGFEDTTLTALTGLCNVSWGCPPFGAESPPPLLWSNTGGLPVFLAVMPAVPEPGSLALLMVALLGIALVRHSGAVGDGSSCRSHAKGAAQTAVVRS